MFIDAHVHISLNGDNGKIYRDRLQESPALAESLVRKTFQAYRERGILAVRDGGDSIGLFSMARTIAAEEGVVYKTPVYGLYKKGYYGHLLGQPVEDKDDIRRSIKDLLKQKADFVKVALSGVMNFDEYGQVGEIGFTREEFRHLVDLAHLSGLKVMVHVNTPPGIEMALSCGADTIEHGYYMSDEALYRMKETNTIWVPTLAPLGNLVYSMDERFKTQRKIIRRIFEEQCEKVKKAHDMGVKIAVGSDAGAYKVFHGSGFFDELIYLNKAGIRKRDLMELAYTNGLEALGITGEEIRKMEALVVEES
jgi:imidazolonepropionase-like amidohydrolase